MSRPAESYRGARKNRQHGRKDEGNTGERLSTASFTPHAFRIVQTTAQARARARAKAEAAAKKTSVIIDESSKTPKSAWE